MLFAKKTTILFLVTLMVFGGFLLNAPLHEVEAGSFQPADCEGLGIRCDVEGEEDGAAFRTLLEDIIKIFLSFVAIVASAVLIYGGVLFLTSAGEEDKAKKAKNLILYAVIGLIVIGLSAVVVNFILRAVN
ncbi:MAG: pilin [Candidatus Andersenbacteria bacterium]